MGTRILFWNDQSRDKVIKKSPRRPSNAQNVLAGNIYFYQPNLLHRSNWSHPNKYWNHRAIKYSEDRKIIYNLRPIIFRKVEATLRRRRPCKSSNSCCYIKIPIWETSREECGNIPRVQQFLVVGAGSGQVPYPGFIIEILYSRRAVFNTCP